MDPRNFAYLAYGLIAAWMILFGFVLTLIWRDKKLKKDLEELRRGGSSSAHQR